MKSFEKKRLLCIILALVMLAMAACGGTTPKETDAVNQTEEPEVTEENTNQSGLSFNAGTYTGTGTGNGGEMKVEVTFSDTAITAITVTEHSETAGIGDPAIEKIPTEIIETQSLAVDAVTGATLSSNGILEAVADAVTQAGGDPEAMKTVSADNATQSVAGETIEKTADVIVIGGGGAGLAAAVSAGENGASVILIEKTAALGGNTIRAGGDYNAVDPERQEPMGIEDSVELHIQQTYEGGDEVANLELVTKLCSESLDALHWLEEYGMIWADEVHTVAGGLWPRAHTPLNEAGEAYQGNGYIVSLSTAAKEQYGAEIILECAGTGLILADDGKVNGVTAEMADGTKVILNANKGVVIASGGFAANVEMRMQYNASLNAEFGTTNSPANVGDGLVIGQQAGANLVGMEYIQCLPLGTPGTGALNGWIGDGVETYFYINKEGERFVDEGERRDVMTNALIEQTDSTCYVIADSQSMHDGINHWGDTEETLLASGMVFKADTIAELAEQIGIDPTVLQKTYDDFNSYVESGTDPETGRTLFDGKLDNAPYYASMRMPTVHHTMGGLEIDVEARVINTSGEIISGLYAAGEVTGGIHGSNRLGGNALVDINVFGRTAGKNAALGQ